MAKEVEEGQPAPAVVPGYGEAGKESASMNKAAHEEETRSGAGKPGSSQSASKAPTQTLPPAEAPPSSGTTETDVQKAIAETAARERSKP